MCIDVELLNIKRTFVFIACLGLGETKDGKVCGHFSDANRQAGKTVRVYRASVTKLEISAAEISKQMLTFEI